MSNFVETLVAQAKWTARIAVKRRWLAIGVAASAAIACAAGISFVPDRFQATARVYVDTQSVLKPLMAGLTYQPDIDQQVRMLARTLISRPNVERLVKLPELRLDVAGLSEREAVVSRLMEQIKVAPTAADNLFQITYRGSSPESARRLVEATLEMFFNAGTGAKKRDSQDAGVFIEAQIRSYEAKLTGAENRVKDFKVRNFGVSGVSNQDFFARVSALTEEVNKLRIDLSAAERSRDAYRRELAAEEPQLPADLATKRIGDTAPDAQGRLDAQRKVLEDLRRRFTEVHPDVISARRAIAQMEVDVRERTAAEEQMLARLAKSNRAATSPVYQKLRISLAETEAQVASLRSQLGMQQGRLEQVRAMAGRVPQAEAELAQMTRDYDIIRKNYDQMVARRESASLGVKLDESSQLAEFRVVEPPRVSPSPVFPGRLHLSLLAVIASLALGVAATVLADQVWPTFDDAAALRLLSGRPVVGTVSMLVTPQGQQAQRVGALRFGVALALLMALQAMWLVWIAMNR